MRERAAREHREDADRRDVDDRRHERQTLAVGRRCTQTSIPRLQAEKSASATRKPVSLRFGWSIPSPSAIRPIAGRRSQATTRSASAAASAGEAGGSAARNAVYSIRPRRIALATAAARSETPSFS